MQRFPETMCQDKVGTGWLMVATGGYKDSASSAANASKLRLPGLPPRLRGEALPLREAPPGARQGGS